MRKALPRHHQHHRKPPCGRAVDFAPAGVDIEPDSCNWPRPRLSLETLVLVASRFVSSMSWRLPASRNSLLQL